MTVFECDVIDTASDRKIRTVIGEGKAQAL